MYPPIILVSDHPERSRCNVDIPHCASLAPINDLDDDGLSICGIRDSCSQWNMALCACVTVGKAVAPEIDEPGCVGNHSLPRPALGENVSSRRPGATHRITYIILAEL